MMDHFFDELKFLQEEQKKSLLQNIAAFPHDLLQSQLEIINKKKGAENILIELPKSSTPSTFSQLGCNFGCVLLSAGQGSRLGFPFPKGFFEIASGQSLFSILCRKLKNPNGYLAIMTSEENDAVIRRYFLENAFFGLDPNRIDFFVQESLPVVNSEHKWVLNQHKKLFTAPAGNGSFYRSFYESPIFKKWKQLDVGAITVLPIDNFKANPQDEALIGSIESGFDLTVYAIEKNPMEPIGTITTSGEKLQILEYSEYQNNETTLGYSGLFAISLNFLKKCAESALPFHLAKKKGCCFVKGEEVILDIFKFEKFIFDAFSLTNHYQILNTCRKKYFCPLKDKEGPNGIEAVKASYQKEYL